MRLALLVLGAAGTLSGTVLACGVCPEDKIAATYDHALIGRALQQGHLVVFAEPRAPMEAGTLARKLAAAAARTRGVDRASIRTAEAPPALSFALDPRTSRPADALAAISRSADVAGLQLVALRVIAAP